jgi:hypothetical protein
MTVAAVGCIDLASAAQRIASAKFGMAGSYVVL